MSVFRGGGDDVFLLKKIMCVYFCVRRDDVPTLTFITSRAAMIFSAGETCQNVHEQDRQVTDSMTLCCIPD